MALAQPWRGEAGGVALDWRQAMLAAERAHEAR